MAISQAELMTALQTLLSTVKFRLRGRRGTTAQLDPSLMKAGEFAFCTDTRTLYACYVDGVIEQVSHGFIPKATYGTLAALQAAHPTGVASDYYMVGTGPYRLYNWGGSAWVDMGVWNDMSLYATSASVANLAGTGRTTETVKDIGLIASLLTTAKTTIVAAINELFACTTDGWKGITETWTFASASTITVPTGAASRFQKGDYIKWTQTTVKYGVIVAVADTLLTIAVNTDYVVTNAAISAVYISRIANPLGFPDWFSGTPYLSGSGGSAGAFAMAGAKMGFRISGKIVFFAMYGVISNKGSWSGVVQAPIPVLANVLSVNYPVTGFITPTNTNPVTSSRGTVYIGSATVLQFLTNAGTSVLQWSSVAVSDEVTIGGWYLI